MDPGTASDIHQIGPADPLYAPALRVIVSGTPEPAESSRRRVAHALTLLGARSCPPVVYGAVVAGRLRCAVMGVPTPGRTGLLYLPPGPWEPQALMLVAGLLRAIQAHAWTLGAAFVQLLTSPGESRLEAALVGGGMEFLADLAYMDRPTDARAVPAGPRTDLVLESYTADRHPLFIEALEQSYVNSLDCPGLTALRQTEDVLATHKATGEFDPRLWFVCRRGGRLVGVLLLSKVLRLPMLEVVYMGVSVEARGKGVGNALLAHAVAQCRRAAVPRLTLAVDVRNAPALALYRRWGFAETARRRAWVAVGPNLPAR